MTAQTTHSLDGRRFDGVVIEPGQVAGDAEHISFGEGLFHSSACDAYGYAAGPYSAFIDGDAVTFEADTESPQYGKLHWSGRVASGKLDGTLTMQRDGTEMRKWVVAGESR
jgi:hypothetical protein